MEKSLKVDAQAPCVTCLDKPLEAVLREDIGIFGVEAEHEADAKAIERGKDGGM